MGSFTQRPCPTTIEPTSPALPPTTTPTTAQPNPTSPTMTEEATTRAPYTTTDEAKPGRTTILTTTTTVTAVTAAQATDNPAQSPLTDGGNSDIIAPPLQW
ncbi:platelet glycoprotein Ib alpha chain-like [Patiria miniata]|uniref:Uncharacterized protein n=1 Tax=Patiria miniata TaxID=46514 RepID=A0A914A4V0_PATMI|nr:platelet glycoprotein Ib alpha chain-like [Patiria miniata]